MNGICLGEDSIPKTEQVQKDVRIGVREMFWGEDNNPSPSLINSMLAGRRVLCLDSSEGKCQCWVLSHLKTRCATGTARKFLAHCC